jgi:hypothetical protein
MFPGHERPLLHSRKRTAYLPWLYQLLYSILRLCILGKSYVVVQKLHGQIAPAARESRAASTHSSIDISIRRRAHHSCIFEASSRYSR